MPNATLTDGFLDLPYTQMVWIAPDSFIFQEGERESKPITFAKGFWAACYPVTQELYEKVTKGQNPAGFKGKHRPVEMVSWDDAQAFLEKLNQQVQLQDGLQFRLPSEAMWEYAARAKQPHRYSGSEVLSEVGWYSNNSYGQTMPLGLKEPNAFGLYDLSGNVWEWCADATEDWQKMPIDKTPSDGLPYLSDRIEYNILRGGSYDVTDDFCRVVARSRLIRSNRWVKLGFRVFRY
ncbi:MAG: formylglycine-generating enzyme family protein [Spirosomataceae bacterium]